SAGGYATSKRESRLTRTSGKSFHMTYAPCSNGVVTRPRKPRARRYSTAPTGWMTLAPALSTATSQRRAPTAWSTAARMPSARSQRVHHWRPPHAPRARRAEHQVPALGGHVPQPHERVEAHVPLVAVRQQRRHDDEQPARDVARSGREEPVDEDEQRERPHGQ